MTFDRKKLLRLGVVLAVMAVFFVPDMITKRWAETNLANWGHFLPVVAGHGSSTVGQAIRGRFPEMKDADLDGVVFKLPAHVAIRPTDKAHSLETGLGSTVGGFLVFEPDRRFVRRVDRNDSQIVKRLVGRAVPGSDPIEVANKVREQLAGVTVRDFLLDRIPAESRSTVDNTIASGLYVIPSQGLQPVDPASAAESGATYLLAERKVTVIEGFWDYSYAENPAGAFSMLLWLDGTVRLFIFLGFGVLAILALGYMIIKPPSESWMLTILLGAVLGGALGNFIDRASLTYVVDFIHMYWKDYHWPRYNIADIGVTGGVALLLLFTFITTPSSKRTGKK